MLISFNCSNFRSYKDDFEFSMEATKLRNLRDSNILTVNNLSLLSSSVIYGANASGKSNFIKAIAKMKAIIKNSTNIEKTKFYPHEPFLLNIDTKKSPTKYEIEIVIDEIKYRYGFKINYDATIKEEWLYQKKLKPYAKDILLFNRTKENIELFGDFKDTKVLENKTRKDALFLTVTAEFNNTIAQKIYQWFDKLKIISNLNTTYLEPFAFEKLKDNKYKEKIVNLIKNADVGISDIINKNLSYDEFSRTMGDATNILKTLPTEVQENIKANGITKIETSHMVYDKNQEFVSYEKFDLDFESDGTKKLLALSGPLVNSIVNGYPIIIDELDNSLHIDLIKAIIDMYHDKSVNKNNAQLIFTTHNTSLLDQNIFRRDQIWFVEKDLYGSSDLYSLVEYGKGKARDDLALEKNYNAGKFGAKPSIGKLW